jgi:hypothetical protein
MARKVYSDMVWVRRKLSRLNVEVKYHGTSLSNQSVPAATGANGFYKLTDIAQGDTATTRDGNSIKTVSLHIRFHFHINAAATSTPVSIRVLIFRVKQVEGLTLDANDILFDPTDYQSFRQLNSAKNYNIYTDTTFILTENRPSVKREFNYQTRGHVKYHGTVADSVAEGGLYMLFFDNTSANHPTYDLCTRLRYVDN